jgi:hypothetical protein
MEVDPGSREQNPVRVILKARGLGVDDVALNLGLSRSAAGRRYAGQVEWGRDGYRQLSRWLGVSTDVLMGEDTATLRQVVADAMLSEGAA